MIDKVLEVISNCFQFLKSIDLGNVVTFLFIAFVAFIIIFDLIAKIKKKIWDTPQNKIKELEEKLAEYKKIEEETHCKLIERLNNADDIDSNIIIPELTDIILCHHLKTASSALSKSVYSSLYLAENEKEELRYRLYKAINSQYKFDFLTYLYPELLTIFSNNRVNKNIKPKESLDMTEIKQIVNYLRKYPNVVQLKNRVDFLEASKSNLTAIPYMARIMADYETYGIEELRQQLDWGHSQVRMKKVKSLITLRKETKEMLEKYKSSEYQLAYLLELYPALQDVIDCEFNQLPITDFTQISDYDKTRDFLSKEEYQALSTVERNQLALDRYKNSKNKSKWQIGRDYELYVGYKYSLKGYTIDYTGSYMKLEDLGRDLIAKKDGTILIIQCKYWSSSKLIHEKHITQLYGTTVCYCFEHNLPLKNVKGVLITNITLSDTAKKMADYLGIQYAENFKKHDFPCIKCNIGHDEFGSTKIYHLPFDQQYDVTKIDAPGEFYAMTVKEAEDAGFRRAFKWHST
ncbi:MAG: restriction endonuclease [Clostridia bacterium]|nr:restriction endonuclease [Clostridia bacterium]